MTFNLETVTSVLSAVISVSILLGFAVNAGRRREQTQQMKKDIVSAHRRIDKLETSSQHMEVLLSEAHKDIKYLVKSVDEIKAAMIRHVEDA